MTMLNRSIVGRIPGFRGVCFGVCVLSGLVAGSGCQDSISDRDIETVPLAEVRQLQTKGGTIALVDPRSPGEFANGRIPGAMNLTLPDVPDVKDSLDPRLANYKTIVVYGNDPGSGVARAMTKRLMRAGAKNVRLFSGGIAEWSGNGMTIEKDPAVKAAPASTPPGTSK